MSQNPAFLELKADGVQLIISLTSGTPVVLHWGADLGSGLGFDQLNLASQEAVPHADFDDYINPGIWREGARGFHGRPALQGHRSGQDWSQWFEIKSVNHDQNSIEIVSVDAAANLQMTAKFVISAEGILTVSQSVTNLGGKDFSLNELNTWLPLPDHATETLDFTGRWVKERQPQRREIQVGTWAREIREGRSGHDYTIVQLAMTGDATISAAKFGRWGSNGAATPATSLKNCLLVAQQLVPANFFCQARLFLPAVKPIWLQALSLAIQTWASTALPTATIAGCAHAQTTQAPFVHAR
ncbi:MAG: glycoside hydrolase family 36 N-terminal domain-containing protein [Rhodoluna sp.]